MKHVRTSIQYEMHIISNLHKYFKNLLQIIYRKLYQFESIIFSKISEDNVIFYFQLKNVSSFDEN